MEKFRFRNSAFRRIGDSLFRNYFNGDHFWGRDSFQTSWMSGKSPQSDQRKEEETPLEPVAAVPVKIS